MSIARAIVAALGLLAGGAAAVAEPGPLPLRWVFVYRNLQQDSHVEEIGRIADTAARHGLNGLVLSAGLDRLTAQGESYRRRLREVHRICQERGLDLIPMMFSIGYGGGAADRRQWAEGLPVRGAPFRVRGGEARLEPDPRIGIRNGGFEDHDGRRVRSYDFHDRPGEISFVDSTIRREGRSALRFENFAADRHGHGRLMQEVAVRPERCYRVSLWVRTENLDPIGAFAVQVLDRTGRTLATTTPRLAPTGDWQRVTVGFNSRTNERVRLYVGVWGGRRGKFWLDDLRLEETALLNVLTRPSTPVRVRSEASGYPYEVGQDYEPVVDPGFDFRFDRDPPPIRLAPRTRIRDGERLLVDFYHALAVHRGQVTLCMSEPALYDAWREQAAALAALIGPRRHVLLSMDEVRAGGTDEACRRRGLSMAEILGDCITRLFRIVRESNPEARVWSWSDMLDPHHNARGDYYLADGSFAGSWLHVPRDLGIVVWHTAKRRESLTHFSRLGFRTLAGAYYDDVTLTNPRQWLEALRETPGAEGIMYTTWKDRYEQLGAFGDLVSR